MKKLLFQDEDDKYDDQYSEDRAGRGSSFL